MHASNITQESKHSKTSHKKSKINLLTFQVNRRTSRKRFSLLQEWENRIQSIQQEV